MKNTALASSIIIASLSLGGAAHACDMHGGGYNGFSLRNASWQAYNPRVSTTDPAFLESDMQSPMTVPPAKAKPSFSNAANIAATKAKARLAKKQNDEKLTKEVKVKKTALNADR